jgi:hypothetical protein
MKASASFSMRTWAFLVVLLALTSTFLSCQPSPEKPSAHMQIARLSQGDKTAFEAIRAQFSERNPGYDMQYHQGIVAIPSVPRNRIVFIQEGNTEVSLSNGQKSPVTVGDIVILRPGESLEADSALSILAFRVPEAPDENVPRIIRPDWDPNITDIPGGCATDSNAYRRILLTWKQDVGQYLFHALNAHRVRIMDSFSHYHPVEGGFDEFYLVQMALPDARIITSAKTQRIVNPQSVEKEEVADLLQTTDLAVGDLVYLPRGVTHRGLGGVLAQVITVPGFIPGSEIGVDHHLKAINDHLGLSENEGLPFHAAGADGPIIK